MVRNYSRDTAGTHEYVSFSTRITDHGSFVFVNAYARATDTAPGRVIRKTYRTDDIVATMNSVTDRFVTAGFIRQYN